MNVRKVDFSNSLGFQSGGTCIVDGVTISHKTAKQIMARNQMQAKCIHDQLGKSQPDDKVVSIICKYTQY